jgi:copper chaperone CopZ
MTKKRFWTSLAVIVIVLGIINLGPAWAQGTTVPSDQGADTLTLKIDGWTCRSCEKDIRRALLAVPGVKAAEVSYARGGAVVTIESGRVSPDQLTKAVESVSTLLTTYRASVIPNGTLQAPSDGTGSLTDLFKGLFK